MTPELQIADADEAGLCDTLQASWVDEKPISPLRVLLAPTHEVGWLPALDAVPADHTCGDALAAVLHRIHRPAD